LPASTGGRSLDGGFAPGDLPRTSSKNLRMRLMVLLLPRSIGGEVGVLRSRSGSDCGALEARLQLPFQVGARLAKRCHPVFSQPAGGRPDASGPAPLGRPLRPGERLPVGNTQLTCRDRSESFEVRKPCMRPRSGAAFDTYLDVSAAAREAVK